MPSRRLFWLLITASLVFAALILMLLPAEKTIGPVIKIVYLHGALSRAGMLGFVAGGAAGLAYLLLQRRWLVVWSSALSRSGWIFWTAHFLVSMPATRLTWGPWIAWGKPRVTMTLQIIGAGLAVLTVTWLVNNPSFTAAAGSLLGLAVLFMAGQTGVFRHPLDPIGNSPSFEFRLAYLVLLIPVTAAMLFVAWRLGSPCFLQNEPAGDRPASHPTEA